MRKHLIRSAALATAVALIFAASALGKREVSRVGNLFLADDGGITPSKLPRHKQAPVSGHIEAEIGTTDGSHPPAVRWIGLDLDRTIQLNAKGLPTCKKHRLEARDTKAARRACGEAVVGRGKALADVAFPEQRPITVSSPVTLFNGGVRGGTTTMFVHAFLTVPVPAAVVVPVKVTRIHRGRYGMHVDARVPKISGGYGSVTRFTLTVGRRFAYKGRKASYLTASCPTGSYATKGTVLFTDGTKLGLHHILPCTPKD